MSIIVKYNRKKNSAKPKMYKITSSQSIKVPMGIRSMDVFLVGGGGAGLSNATPLGSKSSGSKGGYWSPGMAHNTGGSGGWVNTKRNVEISPNQILDIHVGKGGTAFVEGPNDNNRSFIKNNFSTGGGGWPRIGDAGVGRSYRLYRPSSLANNVSMAIISEGEDSYVSSNNKILAFAKGGGGVKVNTTIYYDENVNDIYNVLYMCGGSNLGGSISSGYNSKGFSNPGNGESNGGSRHIRIYKTSQYNYTELSNMYILNANGGMTPGGNQRIIFWTGAHIKCKNNTYDNLLMPNGVIKHGNARVRNYSEMLSSGTKWCVLNLRDMQEIAIDAPKNTRLFEEEDGELFAGGGGCGRWDVGHLSGPDSIWQERGIGVDGGGNGGLWSKGENGKPNTGGGGGGCHVFTSHQSVDGTSRRSDAGDGGSGVVFIRFYPNERRNQKINWEVEVL